MNIHLYNVSDPPNKVNKKLGTAQIIENVRFKEESSLNVVTPTILLNLGSELAGLSCYNYVYIPKFARYYYITNISTRGGLCEIETKVDPLKSFADDIYGSEQYLVRSQKYRNRYIVDNLLPIHSQTAYEIKSSWSQDVFTRNCNFVILETAGKGGTPS